MVGILFPLSFLLVCTRLSLTGLKPVSYTVVLPSTPFDEILLSSFLVSALIGRKGIEVIARMTELLGPMFLLSIITQGLLQHNETHQDPLKCGAGLDVFCYVRVKREGGFYKMSP